MLDRTQPHVPTICAAMRTKHVEKVSWWSHMNTWNQQAPQVCQSRHWQSWAWVQAKNSVRLFWAWGFDNVSRSIGQHTDVWSGMETQTCLWMSYTWTKYLILWVKMVFDPAYLIKRMLRQGFHFKRISPTTPLELLSLLCYISHTTISSKAPKSNGFLSVAPYQIITIIWLCQCGAHQGVWISKACNIHSCRIVWSLISFIVS